MPPAGAARRRRPLPPGRRDRRCRGDGVGHPRAPLGDPQDPGRRRRAAAARPLRSRSRPGAAASRRLRRAGAGRFGATRAATSRSTASGSTSAPISGRPGSATSGRTASAAAGRAGLDEARVAAIPPDDAGRVPWALRSTDLDANGHVNNAVYWQAVEDWCARRGHRCRPRLYRAELDYRDPIDLDDRVELATFTADGAGRCVAFLAGDRVRAVAAVGPLGS